MGEPRRRQIQQSRHATEHAVITPTVVEITGFDCEESLSDIIDRLGLMPEDVAAKLGCKPGYIATLLSTEAKIANAKEVLTGEQSRGTQGDNRG